LQLFTCRAIEQSRNREAISGLEAPDRCLRLGRKNAIDRAWVKPKALQTRFRDLNISWGQEPV
jgi:hypothetical protein